MNRKYWHHTFFVVITLFLASCAREVYNISWQGVVVDKSTRLPVSNARISAFTTYQKNIDETAEVNRDAISDEDGNFNLSFPKGFGLTVRTSAPGYLGGVDYKVVKRSSISDTIFISSHPFNASLVVRLMNENSYSASVPFIRERQVSDNENNGKHDLVKWGFDFLTGQNTTIIDSADVWVEINKNNGNVILNASTGGGIFPVFNYSSDDFLTHVTRAPESGYVKSHLLTGEEAGFFVLCRNGEHVAKMIPENRISVLTFKDEAGSHVKETGIRFDYLFQPDLKNRLYFPVSASASGSVFEDQRFFENSIKVQFPD